MFDCQSSITQSHYSDSQKRPLTNFDANGFPLYKRTTDGSERVVPYNAFLLKLFGCHINVEYCGSQGVVGYMFNYTFKGVSGALKLQILSERQRPMAGGGVAPVDEIAEFRRLRTIGSYEAAWRIMSRPVSAPGLSLRNSTTLS